MNKKIFIALLALAGVITCFGQLVPICNISVPPPHNVTYCQAPPPRPHRPLPPPRQPAYMPPCEIEIATLDVVARPTRLPRGRK